MVQRLGKAGIGNRCPDAQAGKFLGRQQGFLQPATERQDRHVHTLAQDPAFADFQRASFPGQFHASTFAARIAESTGPVVNLRRSGDHMAQFGFVGRRHDHEIRQAGQIGQIISACMGRSIGADQSGPVDGKTHRQLLIATSCTTWS